MKYKPLRSCAAALIVAGFALGGMPHAGARTAQREEHFVPNHTPGTPLLAVVGLAEQRVSIYDAKGKIMEFAGLDRPNRLRDPCRHLQHRAEGGGTSLQPV